MHSRALIFGASTSAGFSATALIEFLRRVDWVSLVAFVGSIVSTAVGIWIARRSELTRAEIERVHQLRQAERDEQLADVLAELKIHQIKESGEHPKPEAN